MVRVATFVAAVSAASVALAAEIATVDGEPVACRNRSVLVTALRFAHERDKEAFTRFVAPRLDAGDCITPSKGERVLVEDGAFGLTAVRRRGDTQTYWVAADRLNR